MTFLTPTELRHILKISRSTEYRLLKNGLPSIGAGKLRRYEETGAVEWFRTYHQQVNDSPVILKPGIYRCVGCGFQGNLHKPIECSKIASCPKCNSTELPKRIDVL